MKDILIYGIGGLGQIVVADMERYKSANPVAFVADREYCNIESLRGLPVVPLDEVVSKYPPENYDMLVAFGMGRLRLRASLYQKAKDLGYTLANYISPGAFLDDRNYPMGDNNIILDGARIGFGGSLGSDNVIRQNVYIGHEFDIGNHNILSVGTVVGGRCRFGDLNYVALSVTIASNRVIGDECLIGMSSNVTKNIESYAKAYGNPAKVVSFHKDTGVDIGFE